MKKIVDIVTVVLLIAAFAVAFFAGFIIKRNGTSVPMLETTLFSVISAVGTLALVGVGMVSAFITRVKKNLVTKSFLIFSIVQIAATIGMVTMMFMLWTDMITIESKLVWALYIIFVLIIVAGYADATAFTDKIEELGISDAEAEDEAEEEIDEEEASEEETEE